LFSFELWGQLWLVLARSLALIIVSAALAACYILLGLWGQFLGASLFALFVSVFPAHTACCTFP
jgi:hypothetical protein